MSNELQIRSFKFDQLKPYKSVLLVGPKPELKNRLIREILNTNSNKMHKILVFSDTADYKHLNLSVVSNYSQNEFSNENEIYRFKQFKKWDENKLKEYNDSDCLIVDLSSTNNYPPLESASLGDCLRIVCINQYRSIPYEIRSKIDYIFLFNGINNRQDLWMECCGIIPKYKIFDKLLDVCTINDEFFVVDKTVDGSKIEDFIYWGKVPSFDEPEQNSSELSDENNQPPSQIKNQQPKRKDDDCIIL